MFGWMEKPAKSDAERLAELIAAISAGPEAEHLPRQPAHRRRVEVLGAVEVSRAGRAVTATEVPGMEEAADRVEKSGGMRSYPAQARALAREHRAEARLLWKRGVRPVDSDGGGSKKNES